MTTTAKSLYTPQTAIPVVDQSKTMSAMEYRKQIARKSKSIIGRTFEELYKEGK